MDGGLDPTQLDRYSRQVIMDEIGPEGQNRLLSARVLVVGAGGLGAPVVQYLAAAGVGTLVLVDDDVVERSNLHRQVIHGDADVGRAKVDSAAEFVAQLNPDVTVETHDQQLTTALAADIVPGCDAVVDGTDAFDAHYLCNDACSIASVPLSNGAISRFEGQVTTVTGDGPCYRCLFPSAPPAGTVPDCATAGVLGALPGTIGTLQATETLKLLLDIGAPLAGRVLVYDALGASVDELRFQRRPDCPVCGDAPAVETIAALDYGDRCRLSAVS
jgi:adenylyltransferase/sulfurtransferase